MARDPGSLWDPLPEAGTQGLYDKTQFIVHSTGDRATAKAIRSYFGGPTPNESTFIIGWGPDDPTRQILDSSERADANVSASKRGISVEVVGTGDDPFNDWQISELVRIGIWARSEHPGIAARICPAHDAAGYGWHVMFGAPGPWTGVAKVCPGGRRIQQLQDTVFPAIFAGTPLTQEDYMSSDDAIIRLQKIQASLSLLESVAARPLDVEARLTPKIDALTEVVRQLAEKQGTPIDMDAVEAVVEKGVADAIAGIETTVTVKTDG